MSVLCLDVGSYSIKAVAGKPGSKFSVDRAVEVLNSTGYAVPPDEVKTEQLRHLLSALVSDYSLPRSDVRISLSESLVTTKVIAIPPLSDAELASAIQWQAERHIPIAPEDLSLEYQVLYRPKKNEDAPMRVLLVGTRKSVLEKFLGIFEDAGLEPALVETQALSVLRSINLANTDPVTLVAHIGATELVEFVVTNGELSFVVSHASGCNLLTKAVTESVGLPADQAEQYVRAYGLDERQFDGKVRSILLPLVQDWVGVMRKAIQFYANENPGMNVQRVVLSGGGANLMGVVPVITQELAVEVLIASPFASASGNLPEASPTSFTVCTGLLSRET